MEKETLKMAFYGDFCSYFPEKQNLGKELQNLINRQDLNIVNFEGPLKGNELHTANEYYLKQSENAPSWLTSRGFNVISLANNHLYDWGKVGAYNTVCAFHGKAEIIGFGTWDEVYSVRFFNVKGYRIGILAVTQADLSSLKDKWTDGDKVGCAYINHPEINMLLAEARPKCDYLFVLAHGGVEFMSVPLPEWRDRYRNFIDIGVDAVIASHPHVPQGKECYKGKWIYYSIGNFCFDKGGEDNLIPHWNNGVVVCAEISDSGLVFKECLTLLHKHEVEIDSNSDSLCYFKGLCELLENDARYVEVLNREVLALYRKYEIWLLNGYNAVPASPRGLRTVYRFLRAFIRGKRNDRLLLHQLRAEDSRWLMIREYKMMSQTDL